MKERRSFSDHRRHVPALRGPGRGQRLRPDRALRRQQVAQRGRAHDPRLQHGGLVRPHLPRAPASSTRTSRSGSTPSGSCNDLLYKEPTKIKVEGINLTYEGLIPQDPEVDAGQGRRRAAAAHPRVRRAGGHLHHLPRVRRHPAQPRHARSSKIKGISIADACAMQISDLAEWVRGLDEPSVAPLLAALRPHARLVRRDRARLPRRSTARRARCRAARRSAPR